MFRVSAETEGMHIEASQYVSANSLGMRSKLTFAREQRP